MKINQNFKKVLSLSLMLTVMLANSTYIVRAEESIGKVIASKDKEKIIISNEYITREFSIVEGKVSTTAITNNRTNSMLIPQEYSEDFIINTIQESYVPPTEPEVTLPIEVLDRVSWNATLVTSDGTAYSEESIATLFDGDNATYINDYQKTGYPIALVLDLGESQKVSSFSYQKRPGYQEPAYGKNGTMGEYKLYVSIDGENWIENGVGEFTAEDYNLHEADGLHNVGDTVYANFDMAYETRYIKIEQLSDALGNTQEFSGAEINLYSDNYIVEEGPEIPANKTDIRSSDLTIDNETTTIEDIENGKKVTVSYEPYNLHGVEYEIDMVTVLESDDHYMRSFLEIQTNDPNARIEYIDMDNFVLDSSINDTVWSRPDLSQVSSQWIGKHELMLGQPIYANGMFFGSEFPATDTDIVADKMQIRYYSGKTFEQLERDNQLTVDGKFVSWQNVVGSAQGTDTDVVQTDFFEYISEIATPTDFRKQYNSWYDNMMGITDESIAKSFYGSEKGLTENGVEPVDSYVVDDGWNNYRDETFNPNIGTSESGVGNNRTGFWEFNSKFPNELYTSTELVNRLQSKFGVWVGPQGGYNFFGGFGQYLEQQGTGYLQEDFWNNVCVGSNKYVKNLTTMFIDYQKRFDVDYWKIDGFAVRPCTSEDHDHMTGGYNNMYYTTDLWEKWTDAWEEMRANRAEEGKDLFINATCYVNLSPWLLQWVNTIWVQDSGDTGQAGTGSRYQQKLTYRDNVYYNLYKDNQVQFPLKNIYNHDPIYGVSDGSNATTEDFRDFLFGNAVRGTAFWELYYSPSIMNDEKWQVNADVLDFAELNSHILEKAKLFGNRATEGIYGYSCWDGNEGIVSFRNPTGSEQSYTLQLTDVVGVPRTVSNLRGNQVLPYVVGDAGAISYGDEVTVTLAPYETRIIQYGNTDVQAAEIVSAKVTGENEITIKYNERIENGKGVYLVEGNNVVASDVQADYRTVVISTENKLIDSVTLNISGERDSIGNILETSLTIPVYSNGEVINVESRNDLINGQSVSQIYDANLNTFLLELDNGYNLESNKTFAGKTDFAINMAIKTTGSNMNLISQGEEIKLSIDKEGYVNFKVKDLSVNSKMDVTTVVEKAYGTFGTNQYVPTSTETTIVGKINDGELHNIIAVREVNGMLKIYIDGELINSSYDEALVNQNVQTGTVTVGSENFEGIIGNIALKNSSIYYDEAKEIYDAYKDSVVIEYNRENWTANACSEMSGTIGDGNAQCAIDGNEGSWWHTNYVGGDTHGDNHWISVDFVEELEFDSVNLLQRGQGANGTIKDYKLEANVNGEWIVVKEGTFINGVEDSIVLGEEITASGIRITSKLTFNGANFAAIKEITVSKNDRNATSEEIQAVRNLVKPLENIYTAATATRYGLVVEKVNSLDSILTTKLESLKAELLAAYDGLLESRELNNLLIEVEKLTEIDYTSETWDVLAEALTTANGVVNNLASTTVDVNSATKALKDAIKGLEEIEAEVVNKTELGNVIEVANTKFESDYTTETWVVFAQALEKAVEIFEKEEATQVEADEAKVNLQSAIDALEERKEEIYTGHLEIAIEEADKITDAELENVVPAVVTEFKAALEEAKAILTKVDATQDEVDASWDRLSNAMQMISFEKGDKTHLLNLVDRINKLVKDEFIPSTWDNLDKILAIANKVIADENAMEKEVKETYNKLMRAFLELKLKPNKDKLQELINKAEGLDSSRYTKDSWNSLDSALTKSRTVFEDENATEKEIAEAENNLAIALKGLVVINGNNGSGNNNGNGKPDNGKLPNTGGIPTGAVGIFGTLIATAGAFMLKKRR